jgi:hypothetical protein
LGRGPSLVNEGEGFEPSRVKVIPAEVFRTTVSGTTRLISVNVRKIVGEPLSNGGANLYNPL